jgi:hypothetical protein
MNNREIVDYILSNKLKEEQVIKETEKNEDYEDGESIMYMFFDGIDLYDDDGEVSIERFCDEKPNLAGNIRYSYTYEVISKEQALKEIDEENVKRKIEVLEREINELKGRLGWLDE